MPDPAPDASTPEDGTAGPPEAASPHPTPAARLPVPLTAHSPQALAALCYTVPLVPAVYLLAREQRYRFVRLHAAQSLVFHGVLGAAHLFLFLAVIILGGHVHNMTALLIGAAVIFALYAVVVVVAAVTWSHLVADCIRGRVALLPLVGRWALWIEAFSAREVWARAESGQAAAPAAAGDFSDTPPPAG